MEVNEIFYYHGLIIWVHNKEQDFASNRVFAETEFSTIGREFRAKVEIPVEILKNQHALDILAFKKLYSMIRGYIGVVAIRQETQDMDMHEIDLYQLYL